MNIEKHDLIKEYARIIAEECNVKEVYLADLGLIYCSESDTIAECESKPSVEDLV